MCHTHESGYSERSNLWISRWVSLRSTHPTNCDVTRGLLQGGGFLTRLRHRCAGVRRTVGGRSRRRGTWVRVAASGRAGPSDRDAGCSIQPMTAAFQALECANNLLHGYLPHMTRLNVSDLFALGFMTFALFLGAGNIIFPPSAGMAAGEQVWMAALGFLVTGVGLPLLTIVALARVGGGMGRLTAPLGKTAGSLFAVAVYLAIGPLFATPRTAVVSFEMGIAPFAGNQATPLLIYTLAYFAAVLFLALNPGQLVDRIGKYITPVLLAALLVLGAAALLLPAGEIGPVAADYQAAPFVQGFLQGYLTMDTLGALVFGIVIATAIRDQGVTDGKLITRYSVIAGLI